MNDTNDTNDRPTLLDYVERVQDAVRAVTETERVTFFSAVEAVEDGAARWAIIQATSDWQHESVYAAVETLLDMLEISKPPLVVGWLQFDRRGELDAEVQCPECGQPLDEVWAGLLSNGEWTAPRCQWCAVSD